MKQEQYQSIAACIGALLVLCRPAFGGPPYVTDDPEPTDYGHYEIYLFDGGTVTRNRARSAGGIDFNYGAAPDLQLTAVLPVAFDTPSGNGTTADPGNIELAAKYKFLHQEDYGWDVAVFPRVFLPAGSASAGERHVSLLLPLWIGRDWGHWSTFGGGGNLSRDGRHAWRPRDDGARCGPRLRYRRTLPSYGFRRAGHPECSGYQPLFLVRRFAINLLTLAKFAEVSE